MQIKRSIGSDVDRFPVGHPGGAWGCVYWSGPNFVSKTRLVEASLNFSFYSICPKICPRTKRDLFVKRYYIEKFVFYLLKEWLFIQKQSYFPPLQLSKITRSLVLLLITVEKSTTTLTLNIYLIIFCILEWPIIRLEFNWDDLVCF